MNQTALTYRKATANDMGYLLWLRKETMNEHLANSGMETNEVKHIERINYQFDESKIILLEGKNIGYLKTKKYNDKIEIIQLQIEPKHQGKGFGGRIINSIIKQAIANNSTVSLSVLKCNKAKELYKRIGFEIVKEDNYSYFMELRKQSEI